MFRALNLLLTILAVYCLLFVRQKKAAIAGRRFNLLQRLPPRAVRQLPRLLPRQIPEASL